MCTKKIRKTWIPDWMGEPLMSQVRAGGGDPEIQFFVGEGVNLGKKTQQHLGFLISDWIFFTP